MLKINPTFQVPVVNKTNKSNDITFKSSPQISNTMASVPVTSDFNVKTPIAYKQLEDLDIGAGKIAKQYKLANGQRVIIIPKEGSTVLKTYVNTGSMNETDNIRGISHYIEHNLFNGSEGLESGEFFKVVDDMGAETNASTSFGVTDYYIASNALDDKKFEKQMQIHASMIQSPLFLAEKLEKEKGVVNQEINMYMGYTDNLAVNNTIKNLLQIKTKSPDLIAGTTDNITALTRDDVVNYFNNNYYPANMVTVITGEVNPDETIKLVSKYFTSMKQPQKPQYNEQFTPIDKPVREDIISDKATATDITMGFVGPKNNSIEDDIYTEAATRILISGQNSRINRSLNKYNMEVWMNSEKVSSQPDAPTVLILEAKCKDDTSEKALQAIYKKINEFSINPPTEKELLIVKKQMLNRFANKYEQSTSINNMVGNAVLDNKPDYLKNYEKIVNEMTAEDIVNAARKYFNLNKTAITVVHPTSSNKNSIQNNYNNALSFTGAVRTNNNNKIVDVAKIKQYQLDNNYRIVLNTTDSKKTTVDFSLKLENDSDLKTAESVLLSKILLEGSKSKNREDFNDATDLIGFDMFSRASTSELKYGGDCYADDLQDSLKLLKENLTSPRITEETLQKAKDEIRTKLAISEKNAYDKLNIEIFKGLPEGMSKDELLTSIDKVTVEDIKNLHQKFLNDGVATVVISAPFERSPELKSQVFSEFATLPTAKPFKLLTRKVFEPITETKVFTETHNKNQAVVVENFKFKINNNLKDYLSITLLSEILGGGSSSRLFDDLRETQKLAYWVKSSYDTTGDIGTLNLSIGTTTENRETGETSFDNISKSIDGFNKHVQKLLTENIKEEELAAAKLKLKNAMLLLKEMPALKNCEIFNGIKTPYGVDKINLTFEMIDEITVEDLHNTAHYIFNNKPTYSILATENTIKANKEYLDSLCKNN